MEKYPLEFNKTLNARTKSDYAYETLKCAILSNTLKPGSHISISKVAKQLKISEIPVREAINKLCAQRLVTIETHVGAYVAHVSKQSIKHCLQLRELLEPWATGLIAGKLKKNTAKKLYDLNDEMTRALELEDYCSFGILNRKFHNIIYTVCPNKEVYRIIVELCELSDRCAEVFRYEPKRMKGSINEHIQIIKLLEAGDANGAAKTTLNHKRRSFTAFLKYMNAE